MSESRSEHPKGTIDRGEISISLLSGNFASKYLLYRKYLSPDSLWVRNKYCYWKFEQVILYWAWSEHHQHFNTWALNSNRLFQLFDAEIGTLYKSKKAETLKLQFRQHINDPTLGNYFVTALMGNIYRKGLATALFGKDYERSMQVQNGKINNKEKILIDNWIKRNYFEVTSLFINDSGLILGEVVKDMNNLTLNRILFPFLFIIEPVIVSTLLYSLTISFIGNLIDTHNSATSILLWSYGLTVLVTIVLFSLKRIYLLIR